MLKPERVILERVLYYLRMANTPKNQELVLLLEQLGRSSCSLDSAVLDAYCDLTVEWQVSLDNEHSEIVILVRNRTILSLTRVR